MPPAQKDNVDVELRRVRNRELELKRITGEISCAECRRLKLKCDKKVPCSSCVRRGCKQICPTGTSTGGNTGRQIAINSASGSVELSNEGDTGRKLTAMSERIRALEDALYIHSGDESHPLLAPELLAIKQGIDVVRRPVEKNAEDDDDEGIVGAFGTLSVREGKTMRFLGASAADSVLLMQVMESGSAPQCIEPDNMSRELLQVSGMWPFAPAYLSQPGHISQIIAQLPSYERVTSLVEAYFSNLAWFIAPIDRSQVIDEIIPIFYPQRRLISPADVDSEKLHDLALLLILFGCGATADLTQPAINTEGERYLQLSRAALGMRSVFDYGTLPAAQTLTLMASYETYTARKISMESSWKLMSIAMSIAASIGLHRDASRWKLDHKMVDWRRRAFWEINAIDKWKSLASGRPMMFPPYAVDCELPLDRGATVDEIGAVIESVGQWRYRFTRDILPIVVEKLCAARQPKYTDIMELDRLVRDFELHPFVYDTPRPTLSLKVDGEYKDLHPYVAWWWKEMALLYVHRNCFARAMLEYPNDPVRSPFGPSFLSAYRTSITLLALVRGASSRMSPIVERLWSLWAISLSSAVIVGSVACRASTINFAASALDELEKAIIVFENGCKHPIARNGLKLLYRLRDSANVSFQKRELQFAARTTSSGNHTSMARLQKSSEELPDNDEELNILRGTTRYVEQRSIPSGHTLEGYQPMAFITPDNSVSSVSESRSSMSPNMDDNSTNSTTPSDKPATPCSTSRKILLSDGMEARGAESMFASSIFVHGDNPAMGDAGRKCDLYDDYLPPCIDRPNRNRTVTQAQLDSVRSDFSSTFTEPLGTNSSSFTGTQGSPGMFGPGAKPQDNGSNRAGRTQIPNTFGDFSSDGSQYFPPSFDPSTLHFGEDVPDPSESSTNPFISTSTPDPQVMANLNSLYQRGDVGIMTAWNSLLQQFDVVNTAEPSYNDWDAMVFS